MPLYPRRTHQVFGAAGVDSAPATFAQYGSETAGSPLKTTDIAAIQELPAWGLGWPSAVWPANKAPLIEDWNSWCYEHSYQIGSIFEEGIPVWDDGTVYDEGSWVQDAVGGGQIFQCLQDGTVGGALPSGASTAAWRWANPPGAVLSGVFADNALPRVSGASSLGAPGSYAFVPSAVSDDGVNVIISEPLKFPDGSVQASAAVSVVTTQGDLGPAGANTRGLGTVYRNTGTKPIFVYVTVSVTVVVVSIGYSDNTPTPTKVMGQVGQSTGVGAQVVIGVIPFIVLPGNYYKVVSGTLLYWIENS